MTNTEDLRNNIAKLVREYAAANISDSKIFIPGETIIPPSGKLLAEEEIVNMVDAALDGWLTAGRFNQQFETNLSKFLGVKHVRTVNSGSSANLVAFNALTSPRLGDRAVKKGDEVITVAAGFPTTVNPAIQFGAIPVFVDIDPETHNIDVSKVRDAITDKTRVIMLAHTLGNPFDCQAIRDICDEFNLWLVEDCCDALGASFDGRLVGTWGDIATLSFYPAHHITMGEGGAVFTNSDELVLIAESFRDWGRDCYCPPGKDNTCGKRFDQKLGALPAGYDHKYVYSHIGYNLKISDMQAACGLAQLQQLPDFINRRRENFDYLANRLSALSQYVRIATPTPGSVPSWFGFPITIKDPVSFPRVDVIRFLDEHKIGTRLLFAGNLVKQPAYVDANFRISGELTNTDETMDATFWIGVQPALSEAHLDFVATKLEEFFGVGEW